MCFGDENDPDDFDDEVLNQTEDFGDPFFDESEDDAEKTKLRYAKGQVKTKQYSAAMEKTAAAKEKAGKNIPKGKKAPAKRKAPAKTAAKTIGKAKPAPKKKPAKAKAKGGKRKGRADDSDDDMAASGAKKAKLTGTTSHYDQDGVGYDDYDDEYV